jgi:hypothetical protein
LLTDGRVAVARQVYKATDFLVVIEEPKKVNESSAARGLTGEGEPPPLAKHIQCGGLPSV